MANMISNSIKISKTYNDKYNNSKSGSKDITLYEMKREQYKAYMYKTCRGLLGFRDTDFISYIAVASFASLISKLVDLVLLW